MFGQLGANCTQFIRSPQGTCWQEQTMEAYKWCKASENLIRGFEVQVPLDAFVLMHSIPPSIEGTSFLYNALLAYMW